MCVERHRADYFWMVDEIAAELGVSRGSVDVAKQILRDARARRLTCGRRPSSLAASALYIACRLRGERLTQHELAVALGIQEVTIRNGYSFLRDRLGLVFPAGVAGDLRGKRLAKAELRLEKVLRMIDDCCLRLRKLEAERDSLLEFIRDSAAQKR